MVHRLVTHWDMAPGLDGPDSLGQWEDREGLGAEVVDLVEAEAALVAGVPREAGNSR